METINEELETEFRKRIKWACERFVDLSTSMMTKEQAHDVVSRIVYWTEEDGTDDEKLVYVAIAGAISEVMLEIDEKKNLAGGR